MVTQLLLNISIVCLYLEANPEKFNSRFRNKMFYAGVSAAQFTNVIMFYVYCFSERFCLIILWLQSVLHTSVN